MVLLPGRWLEEGSERRWFKLDMNDVREDCLEVWHSRATPAILR